MMEIRTPTRAPKQMCSTPIATAQVDLAQLVDSVLTVAEHGPEIIALGNRIASLSSSLSPSVSPRNYTRNEVSSSSQGTSEKSLVSTDDAVINQSPANISSSPRNPSEKGSSASSPAPTVECERPRRSISNTHHEQFYYDGLTVLAPNFVKSIQEGEHYGVDEDKRYICYMLRENGEKCNQKINSGKRNLIRHLLRHTPFYYKCFYCEKEKATFSISSVYGAHCKEQHPEVSFTLKRGKFRANM